MPENPYAAIGLPPTWNPAAQFQWRVGKLEMRGPAGTMTAYVLVIDTDYGPLGFAFDETMTRDLVDKLATHLSGIAIARAFPEHNGKGPLA